MPSGVYPKEKRKGLFKKGHKGIKNSGNFGKGHIPWIFYNGHSEKSKEKMRLAYTEERRIKAREQRINNPTHIFKDTSIEIKIEIELQKRGINYQKQVSLCNIANVDFFLPDYKIIIQADGCYWHNCPIHFPKNIIKRTEKDTRQDTGLKENGFNVYRFWEHEINESVEECINRIVLC